MTIYVLNALPPDWSSFATIIYSKKDTTPFDELWAICILEESNERSQAFIIRTKKLKKGKFGKSKKRIDMSKIQCLGCNEYEHFKRDCPNKKDNKTKEVNLTLLKKRKDLKRSRKEKILRIFTIEGISISITFFMKFVFILLSRK